VLDVTRHHRERKGFQCVLLLLLLLALLLLPLCAPLQSHQSPKHPTALQQPLGLPHLCDCPDDIEEVRMWQ
jgi:hypothetical protein